MPGLILDPRARLLLLAQALCLPLCFTDPAWLGPIALAIGLVGWGAGGRAGILRALPSLVVLAGGTTLLWSGLKGWGQPLAALGPWVMRDLSLLFGLAMGLRLVAWTLAGVSFFATTPMEELTWGLHRLGLPHPVAFGLALSVHQATSLTGTASRIAEAQQARGLDLRQGNLLTRIRKVTPMAVPLLVVALRRVGHMAIAMESRGYAWGPRTRWREHRWGLLESAWVGGGAALLLAGLGARWFGLGSLRP